MTNKMKRVFALLLVSIIAFSFASCSGGGEDNKELRATVDSATESLINFDTKNVDKYIESETLLSIETLVNSKSQYQELAKAIFANLKIKVKKVSVDNAKGTGKITLKIRNKDLATVTDDYVSSKVTEYLAGKVDFNNEEYLNTQLEYLTNAIDDAKNTKWQKVTINVKKVDGKWVLVFNDSAENAVMGGAASKLKSMVNLTNKS